MKPQVSTDSLRSLVAGLGDPLRDKISGVFYDNNLLSDEQLMTSYRNSWIARKIVDIPAYDALRKWRLWQGDAKQITKIEQEEKRLGLQHKMLACKILARLWGGACIIIGQKGVDDLTQPFEPGSVKTAGLPYITVMSRREIVAKELDNDPLSEFFGTPTGYEVTGQERFVQLHPSRLVVQIGASHPDPWNAVGSVNGWGDSVLQSVYNAMINADSSAANIASLVFEANVDVFNIPNLSDFLATPAHEQKLLDRFTLAAVAKSINRALILDGEENYQRKPVSFQTLPEVMQSFLLMVSAAADIPMTRFLGQSPAGLSSTGEHDMKNYYDRVTSIQSLEIGPAMYRLDEALIRSALGSRPDELFYLWAPLEQVNEKTKAEIGKLAAETTEILGRTGLFGQEELREAVINSMVENGIYPGLEDITSAGNEPDFEAELEQKQAMAAALAGNEPDPALDATPRTTYVHRKVLNAEPILKHFRDQGLKQLIAADDLHVTLVFSRKEVDWLKMGEPWEAEVKITAGGPRVMDRFGPGAIVLLFRSRELEWRHRHMIEMGAEHSHEEYQPHITVTYDPDNKIDLNGLEPYTGEIVLGPETFQEVVEDWQKGVTLIGDEWKGLVI